MNNQIINPSRAICFHSGTHNSFCDSKCSTKLMAQTDIELCSSYLSWQSAEVYSLQVAPPLPEDTVCRADTPTVCFKSHSKSFLISIRGLKSHLLWTTSPFNQSILQTRTTYFSKFFIYLVSISFTPASLPWSQAPNGLWCQTELAPSHSGREPSCPLGH